MFGFFIKKSFFDMWDNLLPIIILNVGFCVMLALSLGAMWGVGALMLELGATGTGFGIFIANLAVLTLCGAILGVYTGAASVMTTTIADYSKPTFAEFFRALKETWKPSLLFGVIQGVLLSLIVNAAGVYLHNMNNLINPLLFFIIFWIYLTWLMASQYFFALQGRFDKKFRKNLRKMFIMFFDNPMFTIFGLTLLSLFVFGLSIVLFFILPGFTSILLMQSVALKLRVLKYDYLDANPQADRRKIPWYTILEPERELVGKRTLKGMFFPWKN
ncbi:MAG: hypothetical protein JXD23_11710 [Spirochaetales bacterium]|nr:hypothetical protein [Spirochaetales bacterium]